LFIDEMQPLFSSRLLGQPLFYSTQSRRQFYREWHAIQDAAGIAPQIDIHDLRSTCGSMVYKIAGLHAASEMLAHSSVQVTRKHYVSTGVAAESLRPTVDQFPEIAKIGNQDS
jgi:integrase